MTRPKKYLDNQGVWHNLTHPQYIALDSLRYLGHVAKDGRFASIDPIVYNHLVNRGLVVSMDWHCPLSPRCMISLTHLGEQVVGKTKVWKDKRPKTVLGSL